MLQPQPQISSTSTSISNQLHLFVSMLEQNFGRRSGGRSAPKSRRPSASLSSAAKAESVCGAGTSTAGQLQRRLSSRLCTAHLTTNSDARVHLRVPSWVPVRLLGSGGEGLTGCRANWQPDGWQKAPTDLIRDHPVSAHHACLASRSRIVLSGKRNCCMIAACLSETVRTCSEASGMEDRAASELQQPCTLANPSSPRTA